MISTAHQKAIDNLYIQDVYVTNTVSHCNDDFDPKYSADIDSLSIEFKHYVKKSMVVKLEADGRLLRVLIDVGARWINDAIEDESAAVMALIEAEYVAEYVMDEMLEKECIDVFSLKNASFHVWPYWREYLSSQCDRMRLPKVMLPTVQIAANHDTCDETHSETVVE